MILGINAKIFAYSRFGNPRDRFISCFGVVGFRDLNPTYDLFHMFKCATLLLQNQTTNNQQQITKNKQQTTNNKIRHRQKNRQKLTNVNTESYTIQRK